MVTNRVLVAQIAAFSMVAAIGCGQSAPVKHPGANLYLQYCASCHGATLKGGSGSNLLDNDWRIGGSSKELYSSIFGGIPQLGMPAFGEQLGDAKVKSIVEYVEAVRAAGEAMAPPTPVRSYKSTETIDYNVNVDVWAEGLDTPWALEFLDERRAIVTEKNGGVRLILDGGVNDPIQGTPEVIADGQGGMLDVAVDPDYATNGWIYLGFSHRNAQGGAMTKVVRGQLDGNRWINEATVWQAPDDTYMNTRHHYGTRIAFGPDGMLYFTIGDRGRQNNAQNLRVPNGKVHRVAPDGTIPEDNPFVATEGAIRSIWSYGHRNQQGVDFHPVTGGLWTVEHGPRGGDELNLVTKSANYGWPEITYGINYNGSIITRERTREGMEQPIFYWKPSIAVCGARFYKGEEFPYWKNRLLVSALAYQEVRLLSIENDRVIHEEVILKGRGRVREALPGPDGAIYVVLNDPSEILRLSSAGERRY